LKPLHPAEISQTKQTKEIAPLLADSNIPWCRAALLQEQCLFPCGECTFYGRFFSVLAITFYLSFLSILATV
jgi:hypothetical protein